MSKNKELEICFITKNNNRIKVKNCSENSQIDDFKLLINDVIDNQTTIGTDLDTFVIYTTNRQLIIELKAFSINKFREHRISSLNFKHNCDAFFEREFFLFIRENSISTVHVTLYPNSEKWNKLYSILDYANEIKSFCNNQVQFEREDELRAGFGIKIFVDVDEVPIKKYIDRLFEILTDFEIIADKNLNENLNEAALVTYFNFPPEYETACKQYLTYFVEFLRDIGINATSKISTEISKTIFIVEPTDKKQALEMIKDMLNIYLNLPTVSELHSFSFINQDIAVQQLISNIHFFQGQIALGNAILQTKNATIDSLKLTNYQLKEILESKEEKLKTLTQKEDIFRGILSVDKFEKNGVTLNIAELLRMIKRKLNK